VGETPCSCTYAFTVPGNNGSDSIDLAFSRWGSTEAVNGVIGVLGVLTGAGLVAWPVVDALSSRQLDAEGRLLIIGIGLLVAGSMGWGLRDARTFMRSRLLVGAAGVQLDAGGSATYQWAQIAGFEVVGPDDFMGLPSAGAVMRLRDGRRVPLARLDHLGGDGRNSERAVAGITERVATLNRLLAQATAASRPTDS